MDAQTADSACSATAYLCGVKANTGTIGVSANVGRKKCIAMADKNNHVFSLAKWAQDKDMATGKHKSLVKFGASFLVNHP